MTAERRSTAFRLVGHALAGWLLALFVFMTGKTIHQSDNWQETYFGDLQKIGDDCGVRVAGSSSLEGAARGLPTLGFTPLHLPHQRGALSDYLTVDYPFYAVEYQCRVRLFDRAASPGSSYLHLGWVYGDKIEVEVDGQLRFEGTTQDKPVIPLLQRDLDAPELTFTVRAVGGSLRRLGLAGAQPMAIASGTVDNFALFGLEKSLDLTLDLQKLMPLLTLGVVLVFAWSLGIRTRVILAGFFYLALAATEQVWTLNKELLPFDALKAYVVAVPVAYGGSFAVLIVAMEVLGLWRRLINPAMVVTAVLAFGAALGLAFYPGVPSHHTTVVQFVKGALAACAALVAWRGAQDLRHEGQGASREMRTVRRMMILLVSLLSFAFVAELALRQVGIAVSIGAYFDLVMPLFLAGTLIYLQKYGTDQLAEVRLEASQLSGQLELGRTVQDLLLPVVRSVSHPRYSCDVVLRQATPIRGEWVMHWTDPQGRFYVCSGEVSGEGASAAIAAAAVLAVLQVCKIEGRPMDVCVSRINDALAAQFSRFLSTTFTGLCIGLDHGAELYNYGGHGFVFLPASSQTSTDHWGLSGSLLGTGALRHHGRRTLSLDRGDAIVLLGNVWSSAVEMQEFLVKSRAIVATGHDAAQGNFVVVRAT